MTFALVLAAAVVGAAAAVGWVVAVADSAPNISELKPRAPHPPSEIFAADGTPLGYIHSDILFQYVPGGQIPKLLKDATIAIEDRRFYQHGALDYQGILRAGIKDVFGARSSMQGASTLTMQLVDNLYLPSNIRKHRNLKYKIIQAKLAEQLEKKHNKDWILDNYLNDVPYGTVNGEDARGVGAAAQMFFDTPVTQLDLAQMALLAGLPQAPSAYNPFLAPQLALQRRHDVLVAMEQAHYISRGQAVAADHEPLHAKSNAAFSQRREPYVMDYVQQQLEAKFGVKTVEDGGLKVYTTIDLNAQREARSALFSHQSGGVGNINAALASVDPKTGHIVAMASTASYDQTKFDYPVQAQRQPGSSFKVFVLMTLIADYHGDPSQTYYTSQQLAAGWLSGYPTYSVHTAEMSYQGNINLVRATAESDNTVFAQLAADLGPAKIDQTAHAMGITSTLTGNPAEAIGGLTYGVTPLEMADAYATLANAGVHTPPTIIDHVVFPDGTVVKLGSPPQKRVFTDGEAYTATQVLKQVIQYGTGTAADYGCPAAGKTGTAENYENAWFAGYTPKLSTAVWVGYPQANISMGSAAFGGTLAAPIWHDFMSSASNGYCGDFTQPTTPFQGTAYFGAHSSTGGSGVGYGSSSGNTGTTGNTGSTGSTGTTGNSQNYGNGTLFAPGPAPTQGTHNTGNGNGNGGGGNGGGGNGGGGNGNGNGNGGNGGGGSAGAKSGGTAIPTGH